MSEARSVAFSMPSPPGTSVEERSGFRLEKAELASRLKNEGPLLAVLLVTFALALVIPWLKARNLYYTPPCVFYTVTRVPCFLCGMTRSFVHTAQGEFSAAFEMHLLGPVLFVLLAATATYLTASLASGYRVRLTLSPLARRAAFWTVIGALLAAWIIKLAFMRGSW